MDIWIVSSFISSPIIYSGPPTYCGGMLLVGVIFVASDILPTSFNLLCWVLLGHDACRLSARLPCHLASIFVGLLVED